MLSDVTHPPSPHPPPTSANNYASSPLLPPSFTDIGRAWPLTSNIHTRTRPHTHRHARTNTHHAHPSFTTRVIEASAACEYRAPQDRSKGGEDLGRRSSLSPAPRALLERQARDRQRETNSHQSDVGSEGTTRGEGNLKQNHTQTVTQRNGR